MKVVSLVVSSLALLISAAGLDYIYCVTCA